jgi:hypothetical protein
MNKTKRLDDLLYNKFVFLIIMRTSKLLGGFLHEVLKEKNQKARKMRFEKHEK